MAVTIHKATEEDAALLRELLFGWWKHEWKDDWNVETAERYFSWRYGDRPDGETLLACDRGQCVAVLDSFLRPYLIRGRRVTVRETCDWFCLTEYRKIGLGLHLMRRMMAQPEPIISIDGSAHTLELLPKLRWLRLGDVANFFLPLSLRVAAALASPRLRRSGAGLLRRSIPNVPLILPPRRLRLPADSEIRLHRQHEEVPLATECAYSLAPVIEPTALDWLARAPKEVGDVSVLGFYSGNQLVGLSVCRLKTLAFGTTARIVHLHSMGPDLIDRLLIGTVSYLRDLGVGVVLCRTSCPHAHGALRKIGFLRRKPSLAYWWWPDGSEPGKSNNLTFLRADDGFSM